MSSLLPFFNRGLTRRFEDPFATMQREMSRMMQESFGGFGALAAPEGFGPKIDLKETDAGYSISAELPGLDAADVEVTLSPQLVTIKGEKKREKQEDKEGYYMSERSYGAFVRAVPLPGEIAEDKVKATFDKGVLAIELPKAAPAQTSKKVEIAAK